MQLAAGERAVQVVVGARLQRGVGLAALGGDRQEPRLLEARVLAEHRAAVGDLDALGLAVDHDEVGRAVVQRGERGGDVGHRVRGVAGRAQPRLDLRLGRAGHEHAALTPADGS